MRSSGGRSRNDVGIGLCTGGDESALFDIGGGDGPAVAKVVRNSLLFRRILSNIVASCYDFQFMLSFEPSVGDACVVSYRGLVYKRQCLMTV